MLSHLAVAGVLAAISVASGFVALWLLAIPLRRSRSRPLSEIAYPEPERAILLFEDRELLDATGPARAILRDAPAAETDWDRMIAALGPHFPSLDERLSEVRETGEAELVGTGPAPLRLEAQQTNGVIRIEVFDPTAEGRGVLVDGLSLRASEVELSMLRSAMAAAPVLSWRLDDDGTVDWSNRAYMRRAAEHLGLSEDELTWPLPTLFDTRAAGSAGEPRRQRLVSPDVTRTQWYECRSLPTPDGILHFATPIDATIRAETALREFVQTLTKTFAQLPIGLAVFDRQRQLALFNPALIDLTHLSAEMLSSRPTLFAFLDSLREARMMPEPKDYPTWRQAMTDIEKAAASGLFEETWTLPTGQTYRVTGRPHPDGAVAFLFEDITAEISLTRRFRSEIEMGQAVIDKIEDAIAVFSQAGTIVLSNSGYARLWGIDPQATLGSVSIRDAVRNWQQLSKDPAAWEEAGAFISDIEPQADLVTEAELFDGRRVICRLSRLNGGGTLARFRRVERVSGLHRRRLRLRPPAHPAHA